MVGNTYGDTRRRNFFLPTAHQPQDFKLLLAMLLETCSDHRLAVLLRLRHHNSKMRLFVGWGRAATSIVSTTTTPVAELGRAVVAVVPLSPAPPAGNRIKVLRIFSSCTTVAALPARPTSSAAASAATSSSTATTVPARLGEECVRVGCSVLASPLL